MDGKKNEEECRFVVQSQMVQLFEILFVVQFLYPNVRKKKKNSFSSFLTFLPIFSRWTNSVQSFLFDIYAVCIQLLKLTFFPLLRVVLSFRDVAVISDEPIPDPSSDPSSDQNSYPSSKLSRARCSEWIGSRSTAATCGAHSEVSCTQTVRAWSSRSCL